MQRIPGISQLVAFFGVFCVIVVAIVWWSFALVPQRANSPSQNKPQPTVCTDEAKQCPDGSAVGRTGPDCEFSACPTSDVATYLDPSRRFSFRYPSFWTMRAPSSLEPTTLITIVNPREQGIIGGNGDGSGAHVVVSRFSDMNSDEARGGSWEGMTTYPSLNAFLNDSHSFKQRTGTIIVGGDLGYEVTVGGIGANYAVLIERPDGIYEINFPSTDSKDMLTDVDRAFLASFRFDTLQNIGQ